MPSQLVHAHDLRKRFGSNEVVCGVSFTIHAGEVLGILGPNGAGKSSTMRMLACVSTRSGGELEIFGQDPAHYASTIRAQLGVVSQENALDPDLTVRENLEMYGRYFGFGKRTVSARATEMLHFIELQDRQSELVESLSGGMQRRLALARSLMSDPKLILLDEPTTGLDPQGRQTLWERLYALKQQGIAQILTTHNMDEAEQLCDRLLILNFGRTVAEGPPRELISRYVGQDVVEVRFVVGASRPDLGAVLLPADRFENLPDRMQFHTVDGERLLQTIRNEFTGISSVSVRRGTLEDVFLRLTGRTLV